VYTPENELDLDLRPTQDTYDGFQTAYEHFNWQLFDGQLPNCLITLQRKSRSYGYFSPKRFVRQDGKASHEIALNPSYFATRSLEETLSTLVHEQVHLWQNCYATPGRSGYHNRQWAEKMKTIGLHPSNTGRPGGKELGDRMSHYIIEDGPFKRAAVDLVKSGFQIEWREPERQRDALVEVGGNGSKIAPRGSRGGKRVRYVCPKCDEYGYSGHNANIACGEHLLRLEPA
jgi:hypothetical protein